MTRLVWIGLSLLLAVILALSITRPHLMLSPGTLVAGHAALQDDCFACHAPLRGASAQQCIGCHTVAEIGLRTTKGVPIVRTNRQPAFHHALIEPDCMACHSDHAGVQGPAAKVVRFDHALLRADARSRCQTCHKPPDDVLHRGRSQPCAACHRLPKWKPATFAHDRYFRLDRAHNVNCATCHPGGTFKRYTCYGCHEHDPGRMLAEHREEGIRNIDNCARCHRSATGEGRERGGEDDD